MVTKFALSLLFLLTQFVDCASQLRYPIVGVYNGKSAQSLAVLKDSAFIFNDVGHCRVVNLKTGKIVREFDLVSSCKNLHVNSACFVSDSQNSRETPLLYISESRLPSRCFVEKVDEGKQILLQTISAQENGNVKAVTSWLVDSDNRFLYALKRMPPYASKKKSDLIQITKYRLPLLSEGDKVVLTEKDRSDCFYVRFRSAIQDGFIKQNMMYIASGFQESTRRKFYSERAIQIVDLIKKKHVYKRDLTYVTTNEPEGLDFYGKKILLFTGQNGGIYEVDLDI